jgi:hypothetical protein
VFISIRRIREFEYNFIIKKSFLVLLFFKNSWDYFCYLGPRGGWGVNWVVGVVVNIPNLKQKVLFSLGKESGLENYLIGENKEFVFAYLEFSERDLKERHFDYIAPSSAQDIADQEVAKNIIQIIAQDSEPFSNFDYETIIANLKEQDLLALMKEYNLPSVSIWRTSLLKDGKTRNGVVISFVDHEGKQHSIKKSQDEQVNGALFDEVQKSLKDLNNVLHRFSNRGYLGLLDPFFSTPLMIEASL